MYSSRTRNHWSSSLIGSWQTSQTLCMGDYELTVKTITLQPPVKSKPIRIGCSGGVTRLSVMSWQARTGSCGYFGKRGSTADSVQR
jgi:hypothetical protein